MGKIRGGKIITTFNVGLVFLALLLVGTTWLTPKIVDWFGQSFSGEEGEKGTSSEVLSLIQENSPHRDTQLREIAGEGKKSLDRSRARYLLAMDNLKKYQGGEGLNLLAGLEKDYPLLAPYILLRRGRAYELTNNNASAEKTWKELLESYPQSLAAAEAMYLLGRKNPAYWDQAIALFPHHPRTSEIIRQRLKKNPKQPQLLLILAKYDTDGAASARDRLVAEYARQLTPADWEIIANGYWQQGEYGKAGRAYARATPSPKTLYRAGRGMQLDGKKDLAKNAYQRLIKAFPKDAEFTGLGLRRLASISADKDAMAFLDLVIEKFPQEAPEALVAKAKLLERLKNQKAAAETRQFLLNNYPKSEAAAEYRWQVAEKYADSGDLVKAWQWAQPITVNNPEDDIAAKAGFWVGKWATRLGRTRDAKKAFEYVLHTHPESYYAWRSADLLGWNVGNFTSVRAMTPEVAVVNNQFVPPAGSETFKELYLLGEKRDALTLWKAETAGKQELTVPEQFTNGVLLLSQGKNLQGINQVWQLAQREKPEEIQQWQELRKTPTYWLALFPFPYQDIIFNWSSQRQLNPLLVTSLIRQESRFEKEIRSPVGATGLMQVMPGTASWIAEKINVKDYSLTKPEDNVKLGTWYLDYTHREYNNNSMLAVASYNAGPGNVAKWVKQQGLGDADEFVEKIPFPETRGYVESVFGNYWNYLRLYDSEIGRLLKS